MDYIDRTNFKTNKDWEKRWLKIVKTDQDFDFNFIDDLVVQKLHLMREFYAHDLEKGAKPNTSNTKLRNKMIVKQIDEVIKLSEKNLDNEEDRIKFYTQLAISSLEWWD